MQLEVLYLLRDGEYEPDDFDHETAQVLHTLYALRLLPQKVDMREELGLQEEEANDICERLDAVGIQCEEFPPNMLGGLPLEELIEKLPVIADAFGIDLTSMLGQLPPDLRRILEAAGALGEEGTEGTEGEEAEADESDSDQGEEW